ncbi:MAG: hypothetical protein UW78_C0006G0007 [Candidatus Azambacteria bacterium GW2011_GWA1_44_9]|uniref:Uncharacterized protein n=1 Tax=Candidatus Azambacteria bacterium GW2011_GWA1_44_9 TaxID=1618610 RepID=A0A0G1MLI3_9BACT|nr:MAG: hypothetical protein UW78_C0006G0007 [Candidatus Azambacteria bacterium GW2011_GWA1_44_9]
MNLINKYKGHAGVEYIFEINSGQVPFPHGFNSQSPSFGKNIFGI